MPNEADFEKAGISTFGKQVGVTSSLMHTIFIDKTTAQDATVAFSKTDNKMVKAINTDWDNTWGHDDDNVNGSWIGSEGRLTKFDGSNLDVSNVINMSYMFQNNQISDLSSLSNWDVSHVTNMHSMFREMFANNFSALSNWNVSNVTDMSKVINMFGMFGGASSLASLDLSKWDIGKVTNMYAMFSDDPKLALIMNGNKFADYLMKNNFAYSSGIDSSIKSVTTDNTKLLQLLTNDSQHDSATRTIVFTFPASYSPDLAKYHLIKNGSIYQIKQSADYDKPYLQGTVLINATYGIAKHHIDITKPYKLSDTWQPNYDELVLAHKNSDGSVSFDVIQLPKVPGYKAVVKTVASSVNQANALFAVSFMALPKPATSVPNDTKPAETVSPAIPMAIEVAKPIKTEPKVTISATPKVIDLLNDVVATAPDVSTWHVADEPDQNIYHISNGKYTVELPHINNAQLHIMTNNSTKDSVLFTYKGQNTKYVFNIKFVDGHYLLTTYEIKLGKLVKVNDYNFVNSTKISDLIKNWLKL